MSRQHPETNPKPNTYNELGPVYDDIWPLYEKSWVRNREKLLASIFPEIKSVCELGCGSGTAAIDFARRGLKVYAVDLSPAMCRVTREKVRETGLPVHVWRADMRTFKLPEPVDLVCSQWGVINHLPQRSQLAQVARAVARALRPGGYFYFDLHQRRLYEEQWAITQYGEAPNFFAVEHGGFNRKRGKGWNHVTWFTRSSKRLWQRHDDLLEEIEWPHRDIVGHLRRAGLEVIQVLDFSDLAGAPSTRRLPEGLRTMYLARKRSNHRVFPANRLGPSRKRKQRLAGRSRLT
jgi:SAM-dependent methyltransferase